MSFSWPEHHVQSRGARRLQRRAGLLACLRSDSISNSGASVLAGSCCRQRRSRPAEAMLAAGVALHWRADASDWCGWDLSSRSKSAFAAAGMPQFGQEPSDAVAAESSGKRSLTRRPALQDAQDFSRGFGMVLTTARILRLGFPAGCASVHRGAKRLGSQGGAEYLGREMFVGTLVCQLMSRNPR
jgi:hypothetical protein